MKLPRRSATSSLKAAPLSIAIALGLVMASGVHAATPMDMGFNSAFLGADSQADISRFERGAALPPGDYELEVHLNGQSMGTYPIALRVPDGQDDPTPCLPRSVLEQIGVRLPDTLEDTACVDLAGLIDQASVALRASDLSLLLSVPQASLVTSARGYVSPSQWDAGVNAATFGYGFNVYRRQGNGSGRTDASLRLNSGLNLAGWRVRHTGSAQWDAENGLQLQTGNAYAQHDIQALRSQLTIGRTSTTGELFESVGFDGLLLASDDRMLPDSQTGYAPIVRGMARTNAKVEIRQSGYLVYNATVAPGAFEITDLYATGASGDLEVTVLEADGTTSSFTVPYASVPRLLRPGHSRFSAVLGQLRSYQVPTGLRFVEGTYQRGLNNTLTLFGGVQLAEHNRYGAAMAGAAFNTPLGAFSADVTQSMAELGPARTSQSGHSVRATYSNNLPTLGSSFSLAAYRYSSEGYLSLSEAGARMDTPPDDQFRTPSRRKNTFQLNLGQRLPGNGGSLHASGSTSTYWDRQGRETTYQIGYNNQWGQASYSIDASRTTDNLGSSDQQISFSLNVPLGRAVRAPRANLAFTNGSERSNWRGGVHGTAGENHQLQYNASLTGSDYQDTSWSAGLGYAAPYAQLNASMSQSGNNQQQSLSATGGLVVHRGGFTLAPWISDTIGIIEAPNAGGAKVGSSSGQVDRRGYAIAANLQPYRLNSVSLDPGTAKEMIELDTNRLQIAPRAGAVVWLKFGGSESAMTVLRLVDETGQRLPFGADVSNESGALVGSLAQGGLAYVQRVPDGQAMTVTWGAAPAKQQCTFNAPASEAGHAEEISEVICAQSKALLVKQGAVPSI